MKAITLRAYGSADHFEFSEIPFPEPRSGEVRIKVSAVAFNPIDYQIRTSQPQGTPAHGLVVGRDVAGVVDALHSSVSAFEIGDAVFSNVCKLASSGTYAEYLTVPAELVARQPATLTPAQAAAVPVAGITATLALDKLQPGPDKSLFIAGGAGGVGTFAIRIAQLRGVRKLVTTAGNPKSRAYLIAQCGLRDEQIVDYKHSGFIAHALQRNGGAFDATLDLAGGAMLSACCTLLATGGHFASITDPPPRDDFETLFNKNGSFHAIGAHAYSLGTDRAVWHTYRDLLERLARLIDSGQLAAAPIEIVGGFSVATVQRAHALLERGAVQGKIVMTV